MQIYLRAGRFVKSVPLKRIWSGIVMNEIIDYCVLCEKRTELRSFPLFDNPAVLDKACKLCVELEEGLDWNGNYCHGYIF